VPLEITKIENKNHIDLLYLKKNNKAHYNNGWIKDLWKLVGKQLTKKTLKRFVCKMCLHSFNTQTNLNKHKNYCYNNKAAKVILPESYDKTLQFKIIIIP